MNEFEALTNLANGPIIFMYYAESDLSTSPKKYTKFCNDAGQYTTKPEICGYDVRYFRNLYLILNLDVTDKQERECFW